MATEPKPVYGSWEEALPFALSRGKSFARRCPVPIDVESVVMEALWRAQCSGVTFSRAYVAVRVRGALQDEMRRVGEGQRGNYQALGNFVDVDTMWDLGSDEGDPCEAIDRARRLESLPPAALSLVTQIASGSSVAEVAADRRVTPARISQVLTQLKANPGSVKRLPGQVDFFAEMRAAHRRMVEQAYRRTRTVTGAAELLGVSISVASRWIASPAPVVPQKLLEYPALRERARTLTISAFRRAKGSPMVAARLLGTDHHRAKLLGVELAPDLVRTNRRPDLTVDDVVQLRKDGLGSTRSARAVGVSESTIRRRLSRAELPPDVPRDLRKRHSVQP